MKPSLIEKIAVSEYMAKLENKGIYDAGIEAVTKALKEHCEILSKSNRFSPVGFNELNKIASELDVELYTVDKNELPSGVKGLLIEAKTSDKNRKVILIPKGIKKTTAKFQIAHEFGHLVLDHSPIPLHIAHESLTSYRQYLINEYSANYFAGSLLVDETSFSVEIEASDYDIEKMAKKYEVSYETIAQRFVTLTHEVSHFIKVDSTGKIIKRFANVGSKINWDHIHKLCHSWEMTKNIRYLNNVIDEENRIIWFPKVEQTETDEKHTIVLGVDSAEKSKFRLFNEKRFQS